MQKPQKNDYLISPKFLFIQIKLMLLIICKQKQHHYKLTILYHSMYSISKLSIINFNILLEVAYYLLNNSVNAKLNLPKSSTNSVKTPAKFNISSSISTLHNYCIH